MKKKNLKSLKLNKKFISNFKSVEIIGGLSGLTRCGCPAPAETISCREPLSRTDQVTCLGCY